MTECIVTTRQNGAVTVIHPTEECIRALGFGHGIDCEISRWRRGFCRYLIWRHGPVQLLRFLVAGCVPLEIAKAWEVHKFTSDAKWRVGCPKRDEIADRWVNALAHGGLTREQAIWLICAKDSPVDSTAHEIWRVDDLPSREKRNSWRRSHNGGPICVAA